MIYRLQEYSTQTATLLITDKPYDINWIAMAEDCTHTIIIIVCLPNTRRS